MLHRSFKSAKCKTSLKLAVSRIKLLKNKREAQLRQLKRELAQLLESGQDQTARIRVEHVVREEKTMAAYDLIEIYCELIAARMPIIESQKNCPMDLREAISSIIFASPRCADIPELMDVRKHITAKYGKEFALAAVELRPDCGVNRLLVEKLSARAPDGPTKIKILAAIAEEHKVKWEPELFGENDVKTSQDMQIGPNTYEQASYVEPSQVHISHNRDEKGPPNLHNNKKAGYVEHPQVHIPIVPGEEGTLDRHASSQHKELHDAPANSYKHNPSFDAARVGSNKSTSSTTLGRSIQEIRSPGSGGQEMDSGDSYSENRGAFAMDGQNWNMEFKDAASAAQAAAESAERASMAARAAAELSNREKITRQYSSGSQNSSVSGLRDELRQEYAFHDDKHFSTESFNSTFHDSNPGMHNKHINTWEQNKLVGVPDHENVVKHTHLESVTSSSASNLDNPFGSRSQMDDIYPHNNSFGQKDTDLHDGSLKKLASTREVDFVSELHDDRNTENDYFGDTHTHGHYGKPSSSQFITPTGDHNDVLVLSDQKIGNNAAPDLFVTEERNMQSKFKETNSYVGSALVFDDSGSEDDDYEFDIDKKYEEPGSSGYFSSPVRKTQIDPLANRNAWSSGRVFDEKGSSSQSHVSAIPESLTKSAVSSGEEDLLPVTFDDSDGPSSESEEDLLQSNVTGSHDHGSSVANQMENHGSLRSSSMNNGNMDSDRNMRLSGSAVSSETMEGHLERMNSTTVSENKFGCDDLSTNQPSSRGKSSVLGLDVNANNHQSQSPDTFDNTKTSRESHLESNKELNYGMLKGGLRNKGYKRPPNVETQSGKFSPSSGDMSVQNEQSSPIVMNSSNSDARAQGTYLREANIGNRYPLLRAHDSSSGSNMIPNSEETLPSIPDSHTQKVGSEVNRKSSSRVSVTYFDGSDSEDDLSKLNSARLASPVNAFSRRTAAPSKTGTGLGWKSSRVSHESERERKASETQSSDKLARSEVYAETHAASKPPPESNRSSHEEIVMPSSRMQVSSSHSKAVIPDSQEASKSSNRSGESPSKEKARHIHPKLPDYDSFAAHFLSLRKGRQ